MGAAPRTAPTTVTRAAQYLRMSTEHQRYSTENQAAAIALYALERRYEIVRTYSDEGISGLSLNRREGLQRLLADALTGDAPLSVVLVYDVSRWGRFQNPDQSAHYEFDIARQIHAAHGQLTARLIDETPGAPTSSTFAQRFGSIFNLCAELGYPSERLRRRSPFRLAPNEALRRLAELHRTTGYLNAKVIRAAPELPSRTYYCAHFGSINAVYALVGFVPLTRAQLLSPVGRARMAAAEARAQRLWPVDSDPTAP